MGILGGNKDKGKLVLVFDIGYSSVGGALFLAQKSGVPKIVFSVREPIILEKDVNIERFFLLTTKALAIVADRIHKSGVGAPKEIFCVLSPLWCVSQTRIIKFEKNTPFVFSLKLADGLIQKEKDLFKEEHLTKYLYSGAGSRLIEVKNIKTMINGYETSNPLNQKGVNLEMTIFLSMSGEKILGGSEETIRKNFSFKEIKFSSFPLSSFAVVRDIYAHEEDFLLINIDGEITDISMIKKNILHESISFPLGVNFLTREVASLSDFSIGEAKSFVSLLKDEHASKSVVKKFDPVIDKLKMEWLRKFQESLSNLCNDISIPATIYLLIDREMADFFSEVIKNEQFNQYTLTNSKFKIIFLGAEVFHGMAFFEENVVRDSFLIINSIYINRFLI